VDAAVGQPPPSQGAETEPASTNERIAQAFAPRIKSDANSLQRYGFTSQEIIRGADGSFEVRVAARSRAGNWLPTGGIERYALVLRLYDTPVGVATRTQRDAPMPSIATVGCP